ncbi:MAG TPA: flagellar biosynthetic protein FliO [Desulfurivibrio alkaliphilus]|uniref:Flagellar protein n=1 Tax=Desulfurivibrio alkaliphilus TaxID=427923 RepID=A0A7C2TLB6_9BACT|nr:flagellar biosynthetic protein FliO [Desulfurivibrio alkaliphilus]
MRNKTTPSLILAGLLLVEAMPAWAEAGGGPLGTAGEPFSPFLLMLKAFGVLVLIIGLMLFIAAILRKMGLHQKAAGAGGLLKVIETRPLGPKRYLAVVAAADQYFLLGVSEQQINLLSPLDNHELIRRTLQKAEGDHRVEGSGFAGVMAGLMKQRPAGRQE